MRRVSVPGSPCFRSRVAGLLGLAALGWACALVGCGGSFTSSGTGGKADGGGSGGRGGATASGGRSGSGGSGIGGSGIGGSGIGGSGTGGMGTGGDDSASDGGDASDAINVCADAGFEGGVTDSDGDQTPDCLDGCPLDGRKVAPGQCGCFFEDTDSDGDGIADCVDPCPHTRASPGVCGCGIPGSTPLCLVHRYSFDDDGTTSTIADSITIAGVSPANGTAQVARPAAGRIVLAGGLSTQIGGQYVSLPAHIINTLGSNATFEAWVTWNPVAPTTNGPWQRVFDFGSSNQAAGTPGVGQTYLFMSPSNGANGFARAAITLASNGGENLADSVGSLPTGRQVHVAVVVDGAHQMMTLYVDGTLSVSSVALTDGLVLSKLDDVNNWLGRSQWSADQLFAGMISEVRIYSKALSQAEINASFTAGPDTLPAPVDAGASDATSGVDGGTADGSSSPDGGADVPVGG